MGEGEADLCRGQSQELGSLPAHGESLSLPCTFRMGKNTVYRPWKKGLILGTKPLQPGCVSSLKVHTPEYFPKEVLGIRPVPGSVVGKPGGHGILARGYNRVVSPARAGGARPSPACG